MRERSLQGFVIAEAGRTCCLAGEKAHRAWSKLGSMPRSRSYTVLGAVLALGAPLGLLCVRGMAARQWPRVDWTWDEIAHLRVAYAYVTFSTVAVLAGLGHLLGRWFDRVRHLAVTDPLTGLLNRRRFGERLAEEMQRRHRYQGRTTSILCVDIDHLKAINDGFGHRAGDEALVAVGRTLRESVRQVDAAFRVGGDEFVVVLPETSAAEASVISRRILGEVARGRTSPSWSLAVSIGICELGAEADVALDDALALADAALYQAKAAGGGHAALAWSVAAHGSHGRAFTLMGAS